MTNNNRNNLETIAQGKLLPSLKELSFMLLTFGFIVFSWIFFREENIGHALSYISEILSSSLFEIPKFEGREKALKTIILIVVFILMEWIGREKEYTFQIIESKSTITKYFVTYFLLLTILLFMNTGEQEFIYFQF